MAPMSVRANKAAYLRVLLLLRLGLEATALALFGGLLCVAFLQSSLQFGPDQLAQLAMAVLWLVPMVLAVDLVAGIVFFLPIYRDLSALANEKGIAAEQAVKTWRRLLDFPVRCMLLSGGMWIGWTALLGFLLVRRGAMNPAEAALTIPCCTLLGITNAVGFYFRARAVLRPALLDIGRFLPPDFTPLKLFPLKRKLALGFILIWAALALSLGVEIFLWHLRGMQNLAVATANNRLDRIESRMLRGEGAEMSAEDLGWFTLRTFVLDREGDIKDGNLLSPEVEILHAHPRFFGRSAWREKFWLEAAIADFSARFVPLPEFAPMRSRSDAVREDVVILRRQPLRGGLRLGAVIDWKEEQGAFGGMERISVALILVFLAATLLLAGLWAYWVSGDLGDPVRNLTAVIERSIEGSGPGRTALISDDEVGRLGSSFNRMSIALGREMSEGQRLLAAVKGAAGKIAEIMSGIVDVVSDQASGATEQAASLHQVTTTSEEIAITFRNIAEHARTVEEVAGRSLSSCYSGQALLQNVDSGMAGARQRSLDVANKMLTFQEQANRIEIILDFIREVSERINLISLNASIEASSAGEAGGRFAIIAAEMRKLAEKTMTGTKEIKALFTDLQSAASSAIIATEEGEKQVHLAQKLAEQASDSFQSIIHWAGETARTAQEISLSSGQQTAAIDHLASALAEINDVAAHFAEGAKALENSVSELNKIGEELRRLLATARRSEGDRP